jgi:hypothetical protein
MPLAPPGMVAGQDLCRPASSRVEFYLIHFQLGCVHTYDKNDTLRRAVVFIRTRWWCLLAVYVKPTAPLVAHIGASVEVAQNTVTREKMATSMIRTRIRLTASTALMYLQSS